MRVKLKKICRPVFTLVTVLAVIGLIATACSSTRPVVVTKLESADRYVSRLDTEKKPNCKRDHFTLVGQTSNRSGQVIEIVPDNSRHADQTVATKPLAADEAFALASPPVAEQSRSTYRVFTTVNGSRIEIATIVADARCASDE